MSRLRYAGIVGSIGSGNLTNSATSHTFTAPLTYDNGTTVPTLSGTDYFLLSILKTDGTLSEVVKVTAYNSSTGAATLVRAQEGTPGTAASSGQKVKQGVYVSDFIKDARWSPLAGQTSIDEFNDDSLAAGWTQIDNAGNAGRVAWTEAADVLSVSHTSAADGAGELHAQMIALSGFGGSMSVGDGIVAHLNFAAANFIGGCLVLADGTTYGAGNQVCAQFYGNASGFLECTASAWTNYSTQGSSASVLNGIGFYRATPFWLRLALVASNSWRADLSPDGVSWYTGNALSLTRTPTHVGLASSNFSTANKSVVSMECLRRVSGVT